MGEATPRKNGAEELSAPDSLRARVLRGGVWVVALQGAARALTVARTLILARLLLPEDFGLLGIAMLAVSASEAFTETGFATALVQKKEAIEEDLDTAWTIQALRGVVLAGLLFLLAPLVAGFFTNPAARPILQVLALSVALQGFRSIRIVYFQRDLLFNRQFVYALSIAAVDLMVAVTAALIWRNVWALVYGRLAGSLTGVVMSYVLQPYRPRLGLKTGSRRRLWGFGRWVMGTTALSFLVTSLDAAVVGKLLGAGALGFYRMAYDISHLPATQVTRIVSSVAFPAYSIIQDDTRRLHEAYLRSLRLIAVVAIPLAGFICVFAEDLTRVVLGEKWMPMVPALRILSVLGATRAFAASTGPVLHAIGRPDVVTKIGMLQLVLMALTVYPLTRMWGIVGTCISVLVFRGAGDALAAPCMVRSVGLRYRDIAAGLFVAVLSTLATAGCMAIVLGYFVHQPALWGVILLALAGLLLYVLLAFLLDRVSGERTRAVLGDVVRGALLATQRPGHRDCGWDSDESARKSRRVDSEVPRA